MATKNVLTGAQVFTFRGMELHGYLTRFSDSRKWDMVAHRVPKRDGARVENMGRGPLRMSGSLVFVGAKWLDNFKKFVALLDENPKGTLVHPLYGQMQAACEGFDRGAVDIAKATDEIEVEVVFVEDQFDAATSDQETPPVGDAKQGVDNGVTAMQVATAAFVAAPAVATAVADLVASASTFANDTMQGAIDLTVNPARDSQLDEVAEDTGALTAALLDEASATRPADVYDAIAATEYVYSACLQLNEAAIASRPPVIRYTVPATMNIATLAAFLYGEKALERIPDLLNLNRIPNPGAIPGGTVVLLPSV